MSGADGHRDYFATPLQKSLGWLRLRVGLVRLRCWGLRRGFGRWSGNCLGR